MKALIALALFALTLGATHAPADEPDFQPLQPLMDATVPRPEPGAPTLLQFWASWCHSCSGILWDMDALMAGATGLSYVSVSLDDDADDARAYIQKHPLFSKYRDRYFHDPEKTLAGSLQVTTVPSILLFDGAGNLVIRRDGHLGSADLQALKQALSEAQKPAQEPTLGQAQNPDQKQKQNQTREQTRNQTTGHMSVPRDARAEVAQRTGAKRGESS